MNNLRALGYVVLVSAILAFPAIANTKSSAKKNIAPAAAVTQQIVESVDIQGNRRLRDDDLPISQRFVRATFTTLPRLSAICRNCSR